MLHPRQKSNHTCGGHAIIQTLDMHTYQIRPLRWLGSIVLGLVGIYILSAVVVRIMRRIRPGLTPLYAAPSLNMPARWRTEESPAQVWEPAELHLPFTA